MESNIFLTILPITVILHALFATIGVGATTATDFLFFHFLKDFKISHNEEKIMRIMSSLLWVALIGLIITGVLIFFAKPEVYSVSSKFITKMTIVGCITLNGILLNGYLHPRLIKLSFDTAAYGYRATRIAFASGAVSLISWYIAFILGSLRSLPFSAGLMIGVYACVLVGAIGMSQIMFMKYKKKWERE